MSGIVTFYKSRRLDQDNLLNGTLINQVVNFNNGGDAFDSGKYLRNDQDQTLLGSLKVNNLIQNGSPEVGEGVLGFQYLSAMLDVLFTNLQTDDIIQFNGTNWVNIDGSSLGGASTWAELTGKPTTLSGFGITDAYTKANLDGKFNLKENSFTKNTGFNKDFGSSAGQVAEGNHTHNYEPSFSKNTGFNKAFGTGSANVAVGNHTHSYEPASGNLVHKNATETITGLWNFYRGGDYNFKVESVGNYFPSLSLERSGGTTKTNQEYQIQIGSSGDINFKSVTTGYYHAVFKNNGDIYLGYNSSGASPKFFFDQSAGTVSATNFIQA